jgi:hypothetical protein
MLQSVAGELWNFIDPRLMGLSSIRWMPKQALLYYELMVQHPYTIFHLYLDVKYSTNITSANLSEKYHHIGNDQRD